MIEGLILIAIGIIFAILGIGGSAKLQLEGLGGLTMKVTGVGGIILVIVGALFLSM